MTSIWNLDMKHTDSLCSLPCRSRCRTRSGVPGAEPTARRRLCAVTLAGVVTAVLASGQPLLAEPRVAQDEELRLQDALVRALADNKDLAAFRYRLGEGSGRLEQAAQLPNPELVLEFEDLAGSGRYSGFDRAQTTLTLEWVLESFVRRRRVGVAEAGLGLLELEARMFELDIAAETAQRFLACLGNQARLERTQEAISLAGAAVAAVGRRVDAGKAPNAELTRAEAELAVAVLAHEDIGHELSAAYRRLSAQWGDVEPGFARVGGDLSVLPKTDPFDRFVARIDGNPEIAQLLSEQRVAKARVGLARAERWPLLRPNVGLRHYEESDDIGLVAGLSVPLPLFNRNQGQVTQSSAALSRTHADTEAARVRVRTALFVMYEELQHHFHRVETLRDRVIPLLTQALADTRRGYGRGRYSYFEWHSVQAELLEAKRQLVEATIGAHSLVLSLEQLTGEPVATQ
jgi:cobalt-zinc-cadmium efflux system outer membrane protein